MTIPRRGAALAAVLCAGCPSDPEAPDLLDTGWFDDGDVACAAVQTTVPEDGATGWYWRDPLALYVSEAGADYGVSLATEGGVAVPITVTPDGTGLRLDVGFDGGLAPSTAYVLRLDDCAGTREVRFTTSAYGTPLVDGPSTVTGRTWQLDIVRGEWVEPSGLGPVLAGLFGPVIVGVRHADAEVVDLLGGLGEVEQGELVQALGLPTWNFPLGDFGEAPYFVATADHIEAAILEFPLPLTDVRLEGTFSADGRSIGGAVLRATGDTRYAAGALGEEDPGAICSFAESLGAGCSDCDDGAPYCLSIHVRDTPGTLVPGLRMVPR